MLSRPRLRVLSFNCSPKMDRGHTALVLNPFIKGMEEAEAEVEQLYLRKLRIDPCHGDINCWLKTNGKCIQNDDMKLVYPKLRQADVVVLGTPLFFDGMPGPLKNLVDRLISLLDPLMEIRDGHCRHKLLPNHKSSQVVLLSTCGFWEMDNFDPLVTHVQAICKNIGWEYGGAMLRPHSDVLSYMLKKNLPVDDVLEAAREAGMQLVQEGVMRKETLRIVSRPLCSRQVWLEKLNGSFRSAR